ncbi:MAG TPA: hypothetical protein ENI75_02435 [Mizugakiibacter sp.]|nr:hypothetical protein [Mizugakiibacter sp.]
MLIAEVKANSEQEGPPAQWFEREACGQSPATLYYLPPNLLLVTASSQRRPLPQACFFDQMPSHEPLLLKTVQQSLDNRQKRLASIA